MVYQYGSSKTPAEIHREKLEAAAELEHLRQVRAAIQAETAAREAELERIRKARQRLKIVATNAPSPEAIAYRDAHAHIIAAQPAPKYGGTKGLRAAADEAALFEHLKRQKEGPGAMLGRKHPTHYNVRQAA